VNVGCRSETCCMRLAENTGCKNLPFRHHRTTLSGYIFTTKARIDNRKNLLNSNIFPACPHNMANFGPLAAEIGRLIWGTPKNLMGSHLGFVTAAISLSGSQPKFARCLAISCAGALYIHFWGLLPHDGILPVQNLLCIQVLRSPILAALLHGI